MAIGLISNGEAANTVREKLNAAIGRVNDLTRGTNLSVTVGSGGDYASINAALEALTAYKLVYKATPITATITLLSGFEMQEQVAVAGLDLGWIKITGQDAETIIHDDYMTNSFTLDIYGFDVYAAFLAFRGGTLPVINQLFTFNGNAVANDVVGIAAIGAKSSVELADNAGIKNTKTNGLSASLCGIITGDNVSVTNSGNKNVYALEGGIVQLDGSDLSVAGTIAVHASRGARVNVRNCDCRQVGGATGNSDIVAETGSIIQANSANGGTNITKNTLTANGIIFG